MLKQGRGFGHPEEHACVLQNARRLAMNAPSLFFLLLFSVLFPLGFFSTSKCILCFLHSFWSLREVGIRWSDFRRPVQFLLVPVLIGYDKSPF
jgi:fumarate reductase subunit D